MAVVISAATLWYNNRTVAPKDATWNDVVAEAEAGGYRLISTEDLQKRYQNNGSCHGSQRCFNGHISSLPNEEGGLKPPVGWLRYKIQ